jgi:dipeptidyl aminopeptidase/acylaminoacyl peptidase
MLHWEGSGGPDFRFTLGTGIHGLDDQVVSFEQSQMMFDAMRGNKKTVELVTLKKEDRWLSRSETRLQML